MEANVTSTTALKQGEKEYIIHDALDGQALGEGMYGKVFFAERRSDKQVFAAK
jgi:hypothetical protein